MSDCRDMPDMVPAVREPKARPAARKSCSRFQDGSRRVLLLLLAGLTLAGPSSAQAPQADASPALATPPPNARTCRITANGTSYGQSTRWHDADGTRWSRDTVLDRGYAYDVEQQLRVDASGLLRSMRIRGSTPQGPVTERFESAADRFSYESAIDRGEGRHAAGGFYLPFTQTIDTDFALAEALLRRPGRTMDLLPSGTARLEPMTSVAVTASGETKTLTAYALNSGSGAQPIWFEGDRVFGVAQTLNYGLAGSLTCLPEGWEQVAPRLKEAQEAAALAGAAALVRQVAPRLRRPLAFTNVRLFDADRRRFLENMTVIVAGGRIRAVGEATRTAVPAGAQIISGSGRTLLPGLWDSHIHHGGDDAGALLLSQGITSVRDAGSFADQIMPRIRRIRSGQLLGPRIIPMMIVDGSGPLSVYLAQRVSNAAEGLEAVRLAHRQGYAGIKFYGSMDPALVPAMAAEARRLGLRVQGHVPHGMRALDAVRAGFNEINHGNFLLMQALPDSVMQRSDTLERHYGPIRLADRIDLRGPEMTRLFDELAARRIAVDPTLGVLRHLWTDENGQLRTAYRPVAHMLPFQALRSLSTGGLAPEAGQDRAQALRAFDKLAALVPELYRRGIAVVAGSDGSGLELVFELELYVQAGLSPAEALATATIIPATSFGLGAETGAIRPGLLAELVLVAGDPSRNVGDLRNVEFVVTQDRLMAARDLRRAAGLLEPVPARSAR